MILRIKQILKREGFFSLIKEGFKHYFLSFLYLPFCLIKIKTLRFKNFSELVDFSFNTHLAPMQVKSEIISLLKIIKNIKPKTIMEIGTAKGGTLFLFSQVLPKDAFIISLDLPGGDFGGGYRWWNIILYKYFVKNKQIIKLIREDSHNIRTLQKIKKILGNKKIDFLFIDGDHTYCGVKKDFELYNCFVRNGGIIAFHDIVPSASKDNCQVSKFWNEIKKKYEYEELVEDWKQKWAGIGLIKIKNE